MSASVNQGNHFNLHTSGVGYLNRIRWVTPKGNGKKADPFLACQIGALRGNSDSPEYTYFDLRVSGSEAIEMVDSLAQDVAANKKVVVSFRVGDIYAHAYERRVKDRNGRDTGEVEPAAIIKGRLLLINSITIDGNRVFTRSEDAPEAQAQGNSEPVREEAEGYQAADEHVDEAIAAQQAYSRPAARPRSPEQQQYASQRPARSYGQGRVAQES